MKNVKEYLKKVNIYIKNYNVTSNGNVESNKKEIHESNKYIEICINIYIKYEYTEMYV